MPRIPIFRLGRSAEDLLPPQLGSYTPKLPEGDAGRGSVIVRAVYTDQVELLPTKFYPWQFKVNVEAFNANMPSSSDVTAPGR
jgi:hypothetical protein